MKRARFRSVEETFGAVVQAHRTALEISQEELGFRSGLHRTFISQLERGVKSPSLRSILALAKALDTKADVLIREAERNWEESIR